MAFLVNDYTHIPTSGVIPADLLPADEFSFAYTFIHEKDVDGNEGYRSSFDAHITLELRDGGGGLKATFDAFETYLVDMYAIAPGLVFFSWAWNINKEKFTAVDALGKALETEGQFSLGVEPGGDFGTTDRTAIVTSTFYSLIFKVNVDEGDTLKVTFHNASAGFTTDKASLQIATRRGGKAPALFDGRCGQQFRLVTDEGKTRMLRSRHNRGEVLQSRTEWGRFGDGEPGLVTSKSLRNAQLARGGGDALYVLGKSADSLLLFRSLDEGGAWEQIMAIVNQVAPLAAVLSGDGSTYFVYGINAASFPSYAILKNSANEWKISETGECAGDKLPKSGVNTLELSEGGQLRLLATGSGKELLLFTSNDGKTYRQEKMS